MFKHGVVVRGAGDLASGVIQKLVHAGFPVVALEIPQPTAIRRLVSLSEAVYDGQTQVEDIVACLAETPDQARRLASKGQVALLVDPHLETLAELQPVAVVDAILAKKNRGLRRDLAAVTIALGPGFTAGLDCDVVIETMRGHDLGRLLFRGQAEANNPTPGAIDGFTSERVLRAPCAGVFRGLRQIGDLVLQGDPLATVNETVVTASLNGVLRGLLRDGLTVPTGFKIGDIDPRLGEQKNAATISDKARALGGAVLDALLQLLRQQKLWP